MALRTLLDHPKFLALMALQSLTRYEAMGILETLFQFAGRFTPQGDVGKYTDLAIAAWIGWKGDPEVLVKSLVDSGFVERSERYRLIIHDWQDHAEKMVHTVLARECKLFVDGSVPECGYLNQRERERFHVWLESEGLSANPQGRPPKQPKTSQSEQQSSRKADSLSGNSDKKPKPGLAEPGQAKALGVIGGDGGPKNLSGREFSFPDGNGRSAERPSAFREVWNLHRGSLSEVREFTESRKRKVQMRQSQGVTLAKFEESVRKCVSTPFLSGDNDRGWKATFDWLVENDTNLVSVLEGKYDGGSAKPVRGDVPASARMSAEAEKHARVEADAWNSLAAMTQPAARSAWDAALHNLQSVVLAQSYTTWLKPTRGAWIEGSTLVVAVPSGEFKHITDKWAAEISAAIAPQGFDSFEVRTAEEMLRCGRDHGGKASTAMKTACA